MSVGWLGHRSGEDKIKGPDEEREEEFASGPLSLLMQVSARKRWQLDIEFGAATLFGFHADAL